MGKNQTQPDDAQANPSPAETAAAENPNTDALTADLKEGEQIEATEETAPEGAALNGEQIEPGIQADGTPTEAQHVMARLSKGSPVGRLGIAGVYLERNAPGLIPAAEFVRLRDEYALELVTDEAE